MRLLLLFGCEDGKDGREAVEDKQGGEGDRHPPVSSESRHTWFLLGAVQTYLGNKIRDQLTSRVFVS